MANIQHLGQLEGWEGPRAQRKTRLLKLLKPLVIWLGFAKIVYQSYRKHLCSQNSQGPALLSGQVEVALPQQDISLVPLLV